ncbi:MAG: CPBP family intramembrane metalloprotease [Lachnospiraceae bacterium]|nr:CPBP family intramembrane metalloprotease [Lachnospiraceae bacterium]
MEEMKEGLAGEENMELPKTDVVREARKHFSSLGLMFFLGAIVIYAVQLVPAALLSWLRPEWMQNGNLALMAGMLPMYLVGMPVLILLVKRIPAESPERRVMNAGHFTLSAIICFALVYLTNGLGNIITLLIGILKGGAVQNQVLEVTSSVSMWAIMLYMVICAPIMEEYVFRKLIVDRTVRYGQAAAVLVSGLMFGLFHGNLNQFIYAFVLGVFLAFLYVKTGNLKITIALHMLINFMGGAVSTWLMRLVDLDEYIRLVGGNNAEAMAAFLRDNMLGLFAYLCLLIFLIGVTLAGLTLLIVFLAKRRFTFQKGSVVIPRGKRFSAVMVNAGMLIYSVFFTAIIIIQLFL